MTNKNFIYLIITVTIILIGAITTQVLWISNVWKIKEQQFNYRVESSLKNISNNILFKVLNQHQSEFHTKNPNDRLNEINQEISWSYIDSLILKELNY